ncbi:V-set and immunoglobulin domain-containing protein 10-like isoform X2 [Scyliorhinus torazame]|uniref:V-set and immunoglobulin domain-containing protein 10-like isoform X2 n=1 Tax=Scyliorhinus torazame TaxID=75743 RepID=UPI003B5AE9ED
MGHRFPIYTLIIALPILLSGRTHGVTVEVLTGTVSVGVGESATLAVTYTGSAAPFISWEHGVVLVTWSPGGDLRVLPEYEGRLRFANRSGTIRIDGVTLADAGRYTVKMEALGGPTSEAEVMLNVYVPIQKVAVKVSTESAIEGQDGVTLSCEISMGTGTLVEWQKDGGAMGNETRHVMLDGPSDQEVRVNGLEASEPQDVRGSSTVRLECSSISEPVSYIWTYRETFWIDDTLELSNITQEQAGNYKCSVFNERTGRTISQEIGINVYDSIEDVRLSLSPEDVREGEPSVILNCEVLRGTWVSVDWLKDGRALTDSDHHNATRDTLEIAMVTRNDSGLYTCTARNPLGSSNSSFTLTVFYGPEDAGIRLHSDTNTNPADYLVMNSTVNLTCSATSVPPARYHWVRQQSGAGERTMGNGSTLHLSAVQVEHSDNYTCTSCNVKTGKCLDVGVPVTIYELPQGRPECSMVSIENGRALQFLCSWPGGFPKAVIHWIGLPRNITTNSLLTQNESSPAKLKGKTLTCIASHPLGTASCYIRPLAPLVIPSRRVVRETQGDATVTLTCEVRSNPASIIHWFKGENELRSNEKLIISPNSSEIHIRNFSFETDTGNYSCSCRNPLGENRPSLTLTAPVITNISVLRSPDGETANVSWAVPENSVLTSVQVQTWCGSEGRDWEKVVELGLEKHWAVVPTKPARSLTLRVVPMLGLMMGSPSPVCVSPSTGNGHGLSTGALAGIVVGCVGGVLLFSMLPIFICAILRRLTMMDHSGSQNRTGRQTMPYNLTLPLEGLKNEGALQPITGGMEGIPSRVKQADEERETATNCNCIKLRHCTMV